MPVRPEPDQGEIWTVVLDSVKGHEQGGVRPALVLSSDRFNGAFETLIIVVPLTRTNRGIPTQIPVDPPIGGVTERSFTMCELIRAISILRFRRKRGEVPVDILEKVERIAATVTHRA